MNTEDMIAKYHMIPHKEGGYYSEIWKSKNNEASHIFYLLKNKEKSAWHRITGEELWLFHQGGELLLQLGGKEKEPHPGETIPLNETHLHALVPQNCWQRAIAKKDTLVSCIVSPGFATENWELWKESAK